MQYIANWDLALAEIMILTLACVVLLVAAFAKEAGSEICYRISQLGLVITLMALVGDPVSDRVSLFSDMYLSDGLSQLLKIGMLTLTLISLIYARAYLKEHKLESGEFYALALFSLLGMMILASAGHLLTLYLGLELLSLCLYAMVAMHRDSVMASEAAMKYFVLGAIASGMLLYGMSMIYGYTGSLALEDIHASLSASHEVPALYVFALVFLIAGTGFKLGVVPFHMWVPDVYQGSPTAVTLMIGSVSKLAGFALAIRLLADGLQVMALEWQQILAVLAILSIGVGNVIAIAQTNIKRMLAYSTIAHMGFMLLGLLSANAAGYAGALFYTVVYALMSAGAFGMIILLGRNGHEADELEDFRGLSHRSPMFALMMLILMFSMAGIPPFAGFWAKWFVLKEVVAAGFVELAVASVVFSIIGAFYYLRIIKLMYFDQPEADSGTLLTSSSLRIVLCVNAVALLLVGLSPNGLMMACLNAVAGHY